LKEQRTGGVMKVGEEEEEGVGTTPVRVQF